VVHSPSDISVAHFLVQAYTAASPENKGGCMGKINVGRWILGGLLAGIVGDIVEGVAQAVWLGPQWNLAMQTLGRPALTTTQIMEFNLIGLVIGLTAVWIYAAIRPRFGAGPKTAVYAGLAAWVLASLVPNTFFMVIPYMYPHHLALFATIVDFVACVVGTIAGAALYKEA
jgi:predicted lipid-binding transport protein (Tim44 family)